MNRILAGLFIFFIVCCSDICFGSDKATGERELIVIQGQANGSKKIYEKKYGPFEIWSNRVIVINTIKHKDKAEVVNSFEIKNETGLSYYKEANLKGVSTLEDVRKLEGKSGVGLIIYFDTTPSAPNTGKSFQIFGLEKGKAKPLSPPISIYGELQAFQKRTSQKAVSLFEGDLIKVEVWKDFFRVVVPLVVDMQKLTIAPLRTKGIFDINIVNTPNAPGTENQEDIKFYQDHDLQSKFRLIGYKDVKSVEFINAFSHVQLKKERGFPFEVEVSNLWVKVKINGREGWVHDPSSFVTLGLPLAG